MYRTIALTLSAVIGLMLPFAPTANCQERSIDDLLLDKYDDDPLEPDVADEPKEEQPDAPAKDNPLLDLARRMRQVEDRIGGGSVGEQTQDLQASIVSDLDKMLEQARKACKKQQGGEGQPQGTQNRQPIGPSGAKPPGGDRPNDGPSSESSQRPTGNGGEVRKPNMDEMRDVLKRLWGELPSRQREQMRQLPMEEFLPKYDLLIEEYFRRLSRMKKQDSE